MIASLEFGEYATRSSHLLCALLKDDSLARVARDASDELEKIDPATLMKELPTITADTSEAHTTTSSAPQGAAGKGQPVRPGGSSKTPSLDQFTIDLTARAEAGEIDPVLGRDEEIRQVVDILTRRRQKQSDHDRRAGRWKNRCRGRIRATNRDGGRSGCSQKRSTALARYGAARSGRRSER